jgi:hypothetical protein
MIFPLFYFGPISYFSKLADSSNFRFEINENFRKQTYRNRCYIQGANGKLRLAIPIEHDGNRQMKDIKMSDESNWRKEHFKSLVSAYKSSPFFEFYEDDLAPIYQKNEKFLADFNISTLEFVFGKLKLDLKISLTETYIENQDEADFRNFFNSKKEPNPKDFPEYTQVFGERFEFISDLSILDLLFNEGPAATTYLKTIAAK